MKKIFALLFAVVSLTACRNNSATDSTETVVEETVVEETVVEETAAE